MPNLGDVSPYGLIGFHNYRLGYRCRPCVIEDTSTLPSDWDAYHINSDGSETWCSHDFPEDGYELRCSGCDVLLDSCYTCAAWQDEHAYDGDDDSDECYCADCDASASGGEPIDALSAEDYIAAIHAAMAVAS
jgi:hypothetical protein